MAFRVLLTLMALALPYVVDGHLCLISPPQRGSMSGLNKPGATDCGLTQGPCGGRSAKTPTIALKSDTIYPLVFQKNLDHYTETSPGYFNVLMWDPMKNTSTELLEIPDEGEPSLHLYTYEITIPYVGKVNKGVKRYLQVTYVTKNKKAPAEFYQCADLYIV
ncbi:uncharacterized protein LOC106158763 [Lingula anatina]|uniref:Uncharacterized protein LOC106158763 n=1 Tax=Lingula anatina TaxID=7574 RepID=A0A1S3HWB9_LINAN|nr:uncharacterized protein LOC106158763 [Lingula anatina]|eukprot:XP_013390313.1 uncharacterized protein LOC106158763 [Lingula anatina]